MPKTTFAAPPESSDIPQRDMLFLSHANPEDNEFTLWLALQLANEGYPVWCDLTKLLGGERFWTNIERAIRTRTRKFLYVLSATSNEKDGPRQELQLAQNVERAEKLSDFIIPLHIDALAFSDANILLQGIIGISFKSSWQIGLANLLKKLDDDAIPKKPGFSPAAVASWWRDNHGPNRGVLDMPEEYRSNWFPVSDPPRLYVHTIKRSGIGLIEIPPTPPVPMYQDGISLFSFARTPEIESYLAQGEISIADSADFPCRKYLDEAPDERARRKRESCVGNLLRIGWEQSMLARKLPQHPLANRAQCSYFTSGFAPKDTIRFQGVYGKRADRAMIGYRTVRDQKRYWHFGFSCRAICRPTLAMVVKSHVLFSDDAKTVWESAKRLHRARRSQCRGWWNPIWRDRILAVASWLSDEDGLIRVQVAEGLSVEICREPVRFVSPVSYTDPQTETDSALPPEALEEDLEEDKFDEMEDEDEADDVRGVDEEAAD